VWIECGEGLDSVPDVAYKRTAKTKDEEWRVAKKGEIKMRRRDPPTTERKGGRAVTRFVR
jgi:hypothetical protein